MFQAQEAVKNERTCIPLTSNSAEFPQGKGHF
jgi:hypothetical protein